MIFRTFYQWIMVLDLFHNLIFETPPVFYFHYYQAKAWSWIKFKNGRWSHMPVDARSANIAGSIGTCRSAVRRACEARSMAQKASLYNSVFK
jgi:hypothetical protein